MKRGVTKKTAKSYGKQKNLRFSEELRTRINRAKGKKLLDTGQESLSDQEFYEELLREGLKKFAQ
jgi:DNA repair protein RadC